MNLDTIYQQILLTEQFSTEQAQKLKEVKADIVKYKNQIKSSTENLQRMKEELGERAEQLTLMRLQRDLMKKHENQMSVKIEELLCQKKQLQGRLVNIREEAAQEKEKFLQEISSFNDEFSLGRNKEIESESQTRKEILDLERETESFYKEMELMRNSHMSSMQEEKRALQLELHSLKDTQKDLDRQLREAEAVTESLRAESLFVRQKPFTDSTCLRLRKELEMHKEGELELELKREALCSEIQLLKSKLESSQESEH